MVIRLVAKVKMDNMSTRVLYPIDEEKEERVALLTGIVQLVSVALERTDDSESEPGKPNFMKSDRGVIGYARSNGFLFICEADNEKEGAEVFRAIQGHLASTDDELMKRIEKVVKKRGREISGLWG
jgi:hypothetical protein